MEVDTEAASGPQDNAGKVEKLDLGDAISAAISASESKGKSDASSEVADMSEPVKPNPKAKTAAKAPVEAQGEEAGKEIAGDEPSREDVASTEADAKDGAEPKALSAPKHWPDADKQAFAKLPKEGQETVLKLARNLEGGFTRKSQELSDKARYADTVRGLFDDQTRAQLRDAQTDEVGYIRYLHGLQQKATRDPLGYIKWAMQSFGITPDKLGFTQAQSQPQQTQQKTPEQLADEEIAKLLTPPPDPRVAELQATVKSLTDRLSQEDKLKADNERQRLTGLQAQISNTIGEFRSAIDDQGQLKYPHFDAVSTHMGALMDADPDLARLPDGPEKMEKAYEMAVYARPDLRASLIEAKAQERIAEENKKREAARAKAVTGVKPASGVVSTKPKPKSLDDALSQAMSRTPLS